MNRTRIFALGALSASALVTGCTEVELEPELDVDTEELVGRQDGASTCSPYTEALISQSARMARIVANSNAFQQCVQQRMNANYVPCSDPFAGESRPTKIARAWEAFASANHVQYSCSYSTASNQAASATNQGWGTRGTHHVDLADDWAERFADWDTYEGVAPFHWRASDVIHEFMHTHDYNHPDSGCPAGYHGGVNSVPYIYGVCADHVLVESFNNCDNFDALDTGSLELLDSWTVGAGCTRVADTLHRIALRTDNGRYVRAVNGGNGVLDAFALGHGRWETLFFVDLNGGRLMSGDYVHVKTLDGTFLRSESLGIDARMVDPDTSTTARFQIAVAGGGEVVAGARISLRTSSNRYVVAENGGGGAMKANRTSVGPWETFTVEQPRREHVVRLRADSTGRFAQVKSDGSMWVDANRSDAENQAYWLLDHDGGELENGDVVSLETLRTGRLVSTCANGTGQLRGVDDYNSACARFTIVKQGGSAGAAIRHDDGLTLRASNGYYLTGVGDYPGITNQLRNYSTSIGPWQKFRIDMAQRDRWVVR